MAIGTGATPAYTADVSRNPREFFPKNKIHGAGRPNLRAMTKRLCNSQEKKECLD
jgi:hypothetical protein